MEHWVIFPLVICPAIMVIKFLMGIHKISLTTIMNVECHHISNSHDDSTESLHHRTPSAWSHIVLATVPDRDFGSRSGSNLNHCQIGSLGCQWTRTISPGAVRWYTPNPSELGRLSAGRLAGPSIDSIKALAFGVCEYFLIKIAFPTTKDMSLEALQLAISIIFEPVFYLWYIICLRIMAVDDSVMNAKISAMLWFPNMQQVKLLTLCRRPFSGCGREHVAVVFASQGCQYLINGCLQPFGT